MSIANESVEELLRAKFPSAKITVTGDGYKYQAEIIDNSFQGLSKVKRQQAVYAALSETITSGQLHALSIVAQTPTEAS